MLDKEWQPFHQCRLTAEAESLQASCRTDLGQGILPQVRVFSDRVCVRNTVFPNFTVKFKKRNRQRRIYVRIISVFLFYSHTLNKIKNM
jgi:hypothetical protein